jgi:putative methionine-R-sulfoxide reductase with GAF domain
MARAQERTTNQARQTTFISSAQYLAAAEQIAALLDDAETPRPPATAAARGAAAHFEARCAFWRGLYDPLTAILSAVQDCLLQTPFDKTTSLVDNEGRDSLNGVAYQATQALDALRTFRNRERAHARCVRLAVNALPTVRSAVQIGLLAGLLSLMIEWSVAVQDGR